LLKALLKCPYPHLEFRVVRSRWHEHADAPHPLALLSACCERPHRDAAKKHDELAPPCMSRKQHSDG